MKGYDIALQAERRADAIAAEYDYTANVYRDIMSVGVTGDSRAYGYVVELTGRYDAGILDELSTRITNEVENVNRVVIRIR